MGRAEGITHGRTGAVGLSRSRCVRHHFDYCGAFNHDDASLDVDIGHDAAAVIALLGARPPAI